MAGMNAGGYGYNVCIGWAAADNMTTGKYNICLGRDASPSSATASNECHLAYVNNYYFEATADTDITFNFVGTSNTGVLTWMEDEKEFRFGDAGILTTGTLGAGAITSTGAIAGPKSRMTVEGGFAVKLTNKTGGASVKGTLVHASTGTDNAVSTTDTDEIQPIGVIYEAGIADGSDVWVVTQGIAEVLLQDSQASTRGYWARTSVTQAGRADCSTAAPPGGGVPELDAHMTEIGHCLESKDAGTNVLCKILMHLN